jgi:hypothetical protein
VPIGEIVGEVFGGSLRIIGRVFAEIVFEICVKGLGYLVCRPFSRNVNPDGVLVVVVGLISCAFLLVTFYFGYEFVSVQIEIDLCLDSGGSYNHQTSQCNQPGA